MASSQHGSSPLTRGQLFQRRRLDEHPRVIPAHAGSTHSKPRNPASTTTLAVTTDVTGHPVEQPSVSDRARAEGSAAEAGRTKRGKTQAPGRRQGAAQSPLKTPYS